MTMAKGVADPEPMLSISSFSLWNRSDGFYTCELVDNVLYLNHAEKAGMFLVLPSHNRIISEDDSFRDDEHCKGSNGILFLCNYDNNCKDKKNPVSIDSQGL